MIGTAGPFGYIATGLRRLNRPAYARLERHRGKIRAMAWVLFAMILVLVVWDVFLATNGQENDTWSEQARLAAPRLPFLPWFLGAMVGHVFPPMRRPPLGFDREAAAGAMTLLSGLMALWSILIQLGIELPISPPAVWLTATLGLVAAYILWPIHRPELSDPSS